MRLEGYMLVTRDIDASKDFYCRVMQAEVLMDMGSHLVFSQGFSLLLEGDWNRLTGVAGADMAYRHLSGQLVFEVDDIKAFLRRLATFPEVRLLHSVRKHPWGRWAVRFYDPAARRSYAHAASPTDGRPSTHIE